MLPTKPPMPPMPVAPPVTLAEERLFVTLPPFNPANAPTGLFVPVTLPATVRFSTTPGAPIARNKPRLGVAGRFIATVIVCPSPLKLPVKFCATPPIVVLLPIITPLARAVASIEFSSRKYLSSRAGAVGKLGITASMWLSRIHSRCSVVEMRHGSAAVPLP